MSGVMTHTLFQACMSVRPGPEDEHALFRWTDSWAHRIADNSVAVTDLLKQLDREPDLPDDLLTLFGAVLDRLRMNRENGERGAAEFFELVESWLDAKIAAEGLGSSEKLALCRAYLRAGLEPPDFLRVGAGDNGLEHEPGNLEMPDIETLINDLIPSDVAGYPAYMILREGVGAMPRQASVLFITQMVAQGAHALVSLGRYCLLDPVKEIRIAAAQGFVDLAYVGGIDASVLSDLIQLRKWQPDPDVKSTLDHAIKEALRREPAGGSVSGAWKVHRLVSSLPDGTGSQSILASVSRGSQRNVVTLLIKAGHGIKDAYAIPCTSASDQRRTLAEMEETMPAHEVSEDYLSDALARALGEGIAKGLPPAPGFVDAVQMLGLDSLAPLHEGPSTALKVADPQSQLREMSVAKRRRLISKSIDWVQEYEMSSSWFVSDATLSAKLEQTKTEHQAEKAVWTHLETYREFWSWLFARSAAILRAAESEDWMVFAAVVHALETGRDLKRIPIFEMISALSLDVDEQRDSGMFFDGNDMPNDPIDDIDFDPVIEPEASGELGRLLRKSELSPQMVNGYLTSVIVAPKFVTPTDWLPPLLDGINMPNGKKLQRVLDIVMLRFSGLQDDLFNGNTASAFSTKSASNFQDWLSGFAQASSITAAWPKRALSSDDQKILKLIKEGAEGNKTLTTLKPLLPSWVGVMAAKAMDN